MEWMPGINQGWSENYHRYRTKYPPTFFLHIQYQYSVNLGLPGTRYVVARYCSEVTSQVLYPPPKKKIIKKL
jgi:hypothetical protein